MLPPNKSVSQYRPDIQCISDISSHQFIHPTKQIVSSIHITPLWSSSTTYYELIQFISSINSLVYGRLCTDKIESSRNVQYITEWLTQLKLSLAQYPPMQQDTRYGNKGYRYWYEHMKLQAYELNKQLLGQYDLPDHNKQLALDELNSYLVDSFGNYQRIDYGTGHELNYILYLLCLYKLNILQYTDLISIGVKIICHYLQLMQSVQLQYYLEPAGSKGAWGLDDYQFIVFYFGTGQLIGSDIVCMTMNDIQQVRQLKDDYLLFSGIDFIHKVKSGPFYEHSAILYQISQLTSWNKANNGLLQMYQNEVLNKYPIVQHILFGSILTLKKHNAAQKSIQSD